MEATTPLARVGMDDDHPMLMLIMVCLIMAGILLIPAGVEVARRGGRAFRRFLGAGAGRHGLESSRDLGPEREVASRGHRCPLCGTETDVRECVWPSCRHHVPDYHGLPLEEKLCLALTHPVRENRLLAIELLGESGGPSALAALRELLAAETDPHVVVEIALAAARVGGDEARAILAGLRSHGSAMVREVAGRLCDEIDPQGARGRGAQDLSSRDDRMAFR